MSTTHNEAVSRALTLAGLILLAGCPARDVLLLDGSSTVYPIAEAVAEELAARGAIDIAIGVSGTGGGLKKLCAGEVAIATASRPISAGELAACSAHGIVPIELPIAKDGITLLVPSENAFVDVLSVAELKRLWEPAAQGRVRRWSQVRAGWPDTEVHLYGPGVDSGTYDAFTRAIVGQAHTSRGDFTASEDDNLIVQGVATDPGGLGFVGFAYVEDNRERVRAVPIAVDGVAVAPSATTISDGSYRPLSRPLFFYVGDGAKDRADVRRLVALLSSDGPALVRDAGYVPLPPVSYAALPGLLGQAGPR